MRNKVSIAVVLMGILVGSSAGQLPGFPTPEPPLAQPLPGNDSKPMVPPFGAGLPGSQGKSDLPGGFPALPGSVAPMPPIGSPPLPGSTGQPGGFPTNPLQGSMPGMGKESSTPPLASPNSGDTKGNSGGTSSFVGPLPSLNPVDPPFPQVLLRTRVVGVASPNEEVTYRLQVTNPSGAPAHQVRVRQSKPAQGNFLKATPTPITQDGGELIWQLGTLEPGATKDIVVVFVANGLGDLESTARVSFEYGQTVRTKLESALQVKTGGPSSLMVNDTFTLTTQVTHAGNSPLEDVTLTQTVPPGAEFLNSNPAATGDSVLQWKLGKIEPGTTKNITIQLVARKAGPMETRAVVTSGTQKREADLKLNVGQVTLEMSKGGPDRRVVGRSATYFISVINRGSIPATNVKITNKLNPNVEFLSADSGGAVTQGEVRWMIPSLGAGEKRTVSMVIRGLRAGDLTTRAEVVADRQPTGLQAEKLTRFESQKSLMVEVDKLAEPVAPGEQTSFRIKLLNFGTQTYKGAVVSVTMPPEMLVLDAQGQTGANRQGQTVVFAPIAALLPNQEPAFSVYAKAIKAGEARLRVEVKSPELPGGQMLFEESLQIIAPAGGTGSASSPAGMPGGFPGLPGM